MPLTLGPVFPEEERRGVGEKKKGLAEEKKRGRPEEKIFPGKQSPGAGQEFRTKNFRTKQSSDRPNRRVGALGGFPRGKGAAGAGEK